MHTCTRYYMLPTTLCIFACFFLYLFVHDFYDETWLCLYVECWFEEFDESLIGESVPRPSFGVDRKFVSIWFDVLNWIIYHNNAL